MTKRFRSVLALTASALAVALLARSATAQQVTFGGRLVDAKDVPSQVGSPGTLLPANPDVSPLFGTSQWSVYTVGPCDGFVRTVSSAISQSDCSSVESSGVGSAYLGYPVHLLSGASMQYVRLYYWENDAAVRPSVGFYKVDHVNGVATSIQNMDPASGTTAGDASYQWGPFSDTVDNYTYTYHFLVGLSKTASATTRLRQIMIYYKLQVSPAPGVATFSDVPLTDGRNQFVEAIYASGITNGCSTVPLLFCPDAFLTRGQMAVFLAKALGLQYTY